MKKIAIYGFIAALGLASALASAQYTKPMGMSLRGGLFYPSNSWAKSAGNSWFAVGLDYKLKDLKYGNSEPGYSANCSISVDWYGKNDFSNVPVLLNYTARKDAMYYSVGAGIGFTKSIDTNSNSESKADYAFQLSVGYDFVQGETPVFIEGRYWGSGRSDLSGFGIYAGVRF